jgi:hypothetical protein
MQCAACLAAAAAAGSSDGWWIEDLTGCVVSCTYAIISGAACYFTAVSMTSATGSTCAQLNTAVGLRSSDDVGATNRGAAASGQSFICYF